MSAAPGAGWSGARRFYAAATPAPAADGAGFTVRLDDRSLRTPAGRPFVLPTEALAALVAAEWDGQGETLSPASMPATRFSAGALDWTPDHREAIALRVRSFCETDLVCHLAAEEAELRALQEAAWTPLRAWAAERLGVALKPTRGVIARPQAEASLAAAAAAARLLDDFAVTGLSISLGLFGSAVIGLAFVHGRIDSEAALHAARIDVAWQIERWGLDAEAAARAQAEAAEAQALGRWLAAARSPA